jgi:4-hydroxyphenylacetaldehyde oxime monooxygenase
MAELVRNPGLLKKLKCEIRSMVGDDKDRVHADDIPKPRYLKMVVLDN